MSHGVYCMAAFFAYEYWVQYLTSHGLVVESCDMCLEKEKKLEPESQLQLPGFLWYPIH